MQDNPTEQPTPTAPKLASDVSPEAEEVGVTTVTEDVPDDVETADNQGDGNTDGPLQPDPASEKANFSPGIDASVSAPPTVGEEETMTNTPRADDQSQKGSTPDDGATDNGVHGASESPRAMGGIDSSTVATEEGSTAIVCDLAGEADEKFSVPCVAAENDALERGGGVGGNDGDGGQAEGDRVGDDDAPDEEVGDDVKDESVAKLAERVGGDPIAEVDRGMTNGDIPGEGAGIGGVAEEFFAEVSSSGEDDLHPVAAAADATGDLGELSDANENDERLPDFGTLKGEQPPSPRLIASSVGRAGGVGGGFGYSRSPTGTQRKAGAAEEGLSEAAKAAVAAALAAASAPAPAGRTGRSSRGEDEGSKSRKKKSHKERRRKGSNSGKEDESGVGVRHGGVGRSEVDGGQEKRSGKRDGSSRRHHRRSAV